MSFYLTLPSDSSLSYFSDNKISHFISRLPTPIDLNGEWEVGLVELIYPHSWCNVSEGSNVFEYAVEDGPMKEAKIPGGYYETIADVVKAMSHHFKKHIYMYYNKASRRVKMTLTKGSRLKLSKGLAEILGYESSEFSSEGSDLTIVGQFVADLNSVFSLLYVYSDIVEPQFVGDVHAPLLRIVKVEGDDCEMVSALYDRPHYLPLARKNFQTIEIVIRRHTGQLVPFERGRAIVKLHFRLKHL